jgi:uncharacterized protein YndB with AHSA1/START domain
MNAKENPIVRISRRFGASPERVFDAWLDPEMIGSFLFGPALRDEEILHISVDARVGGSFSFLVRRQGQELDHVGKYLELDRPHRLVFTWRVEPSKDDSRVAIDIVPIGGAPDATGPTKSGSELTLTHELHPAWADYADRTAQGWNKMLDALAARLA